MQFTTIIASALAVAFAAAVPQTPASYGSAPIYPVSNGTTTAIATGVAPTGTGAAVPTSSTGATFTGGASQIFGSSAAMGLVLVGGVALAL